ncbi:Hypothetical Protein FCC1311_096602 [Hondaea fermentalgiana]|uniref:Uncharacterized protein n=1 Tax=Hondaea fermentalgiana TaxID=2315210 RepID=A0A2R5GRC9_9STRA|nr:Hypothetical Protein FCC1311_096602 [Hondaea fermentalgiana]|eukprot:GBG33437.1 Hypothetical Protein FCC1311_096602 [Hondaea fermentalgiana]
MAEKKRDAPSQLGGEEDRVAKRQKLAEQLESFNKTVALNVPVSTILPLSGLAEQEIDGLTEVLNGLVLLAETLASEGRREDIQRALLDVAEFLVVAKDKLCTQDEGKLPPLRKLVSHYESLVEKAKSKIDYRALSIFMENKIGETSVDKNGPICSEFNRIKSRLNRCTNMTWDEREKMIDDLLRSVKDKRRGFLVEGRDSIRGYRDMSDRELQGWFTLATELAGDD